MHVNAKGGRAIFESTFVRSSILFVSTPYVHIDPHDHHPQLQQQGSARSGRGASGWSRVSWGWRS